MEQKIRRVNSYNVMTKMLILSNINWKTENYWGWQQITGWDDVLLLKLYKKYQNIFLTLFYFRVHKWEMLKLKLSEKWWRKAKIF